MPTTLANDLRRSETTYVLGTLLLLGVLALAALTLSAGPAPTPDATADPGARWQWHWADGPTY